MRDDADATTKNILSGAEGIKEVNDHVLILPAQGNALAVKAREGLVLVDSGPGRGATKKMMAALREWSDLPVRAICYSHGHVGYNDGVRMWVDAAAERGEAAPMLIAQENCIRRYNRYRETGGLQHALNTMQFPQFDMADSRALIVNPTVTFREHMVLDTGSPRIELIAAPSETDDVLSLWLPEDRILYAGAAFPGTTIPNVGTPLRTLRLTIRWAETLEKLAALKPAVLIQEFGRVIEGEQAVADRLLGSAEALRWIRREVVERMNRGMSDLEIIHDIDYPDHLFDQSWMRERYGARDYIVRDMFREENGWWDRNPTTLHPAHPDDAGRAVLEAIGDPQTVLAKARSLAEAGDAQLALHVIDLLALAPGSDPAVVEAQKLKAEICRTRAGEVAPYVSKALYESSARLLEKGKRRWSEREELQAAAE
ncbi:MAG: alkyl sulfatase dimerization domain-containing protein [Minwuia sp.]|uniref:alkyl sulfatase dimerization domain-containing protein n=1 Tax=Minwuia sp. TaxID=2493630 RepID=UPI003A85F294